MRILFLDTETTGLNPATHEVIELAIVDEAGAVLLHTRVRPTHPETADPRAVEVTGYTAEGWADAPTFAEIAAQVSELLRGAVVCGHNVGFDVDMLRAELQRVDPALAERVGYYRLDTMVLALEHLKPIGCASMSLGSVCKFIGVELINAHTALADTLAAREVYRKLARAGWLRRLGWRVANRLRR